MHDLSVPLMIALIALQLIIVVEPDGPKLAAPLAVGGTLMSIVAITLMLHLSVPVSRTVALGGWTVAIVASVVALRSIRLVLERRSTAQVTLGCSSVEHSQLPEEVDRDQR